jgi:hypothetical protein
MDGASSRMAAVDMVAAAAGAQVVRLDDDDALSKAARAAAKRMFQVGRTDEQFEREMAERQWLEQFQAARLAELSAESPALDLGAAAAAAERRINEQWRPKS